MAPIRDKHILIVGGSTGLGFAVAQLALNEGAIVTIASSNIDKLADAAQRLKDDGSVKTIVVNLKDEVSIKEMYQQVGSCDHLIYTAGDNASQAIKFPDFDLETARRANDVRHFGFILCAKHAPGHVKESLTCTAGSLVQKPTPGFLGSGGGALIGDTRALAFSLAPALRVNCVAPGIVDTTMWEHVSREDRDRWFQAEASKTLLKRLATPEDVAEAYLYSMKAGFVTGQTFYVEGGSFLV